MSHEIVLNVPDEVYLPLEEQARKFGRTPEAVINDWLAHMVRLNQEPLRRWAGAFASGLPDAAERHHAHLGQQLQAPTETPGDG
jgi:hypothetical protein